MFENVSWPMYLGGLVAVAVVYYLYVGLRYYGFEIKNLFAPKAAPADAEVFDMFTPHTGKGDVQQQEELYADVEILSSTIKRFVAEAYERKASAEEMKTGLREILSNYSNLSHSPFRTALTELILSECGRYGAVVIDVDDVDEAWGV